MVDTFLLFCYIFNSFTLNTKEIHYENTNSR